MLILSPLSSQDKTYLLPLRYTVFVKAICRLGSSWAVSWISGNCKISKGRNSSAWFNIGSLGSAVSVGAVELALVLGCLFRSGHSCFQCPFRPQRLHEVSRILCCKLFRCPFWAPLNFPFVPLHFGKSRARNHDCVKSSETKTGDFQVLSSG